MINAAAIGGEHGQAKSSLQHPEFSELSSVFPPFPIERDVEFFIQPEQGAEIPAFPMHKLFVALIEQLRTTPQELLHDGAIVPFENFVPLKSKFAASLHMIKML